MLGDHGTLRFNQLSNLIGSISQKMLATTLKGLEVDGLISRKMFPEIPPRVEYILTGMGESLLPAVATLNNRAAEHMPAILASRAQHLSIKG